LLLAYIAVDDKPRALDMIERGYAERDNYEINIGVDPLIDPLRREPRFQSVCRQLMVGSPSAVAHLLIPDAALARRKGGSY